MACCSKYHMELDEEGRGKCSVPMWVSGCPAGFCDNESYGPQLPEVQARWFKGAAFAPHLACPNHGGPKVRTFQDGDKWCAVHADFRNLQENEVGFGDTPEAARAALRSVAP